ncbi:MAG: tetratricopeptide repeat protein [Bacteroidia bacterium]|nr:tetratricopeptide repeat protein [Bacteroidia bacterium]
MRLSIPFGILAGIFFSLFFLPGFGYAQNPGKAAYVQGENLRKQNKCDEAVLKYQEAFKLEPENYRYSFAEGKCYYKLKQYDLAISAFEKTASAKPDFTAAYSILAKIYTRQKDYGKAIEYYDLAAKYEDNKDRKVSYKLLIVQMLLQDGKTNEAMSHISEAKAIDPQNLKILYYDAKISNKNGDYENAKSSMLVATPQLKDAPPAKSAPYFYELGYAYNQLGDYQGAKAAWDNANFGPYKSLIAQQLSKNSPAYFYKTAVSYFTAGEYSQAESQISNALELQNDFPPATILQGKIAKKQGNLSQAASYFNQAANSESDPEKKAQLLMYALTTQVDAGDFSGALSTANNVLASSPGNTTAMFIKAQAQYKMGQYSSSISTLESLLSNPSLDAMSKAKYNFTLGMAAKNNMDTEKAKNAFKNAMGGPFKPAAKAELDLLLGKG